jgi:DMSO/TMAO reductase YedYZ heme-binding membrane subunit
VSTESVIVATGIVLGMVLFFFGMVLAIVSNVMEERSQEDKWKSLRWFGIVVLGLGVVVFSVFFVAMFFTDEYQYG